MLRLKAFILECQNFIRALIQTTLNEHIGHKIYLCLQKDYGKKEGKWKTIAIQKCGGEPYELALRFAGCCFRCGPCFASGYAWIDKFQSNRRVTCGKRTEDVIQDYKDIPYPHNYDSYNWLRILGGEPLLNDEYIRFLFDVIIEMSKIDSQKFNNGVVIQTNGIFVGQGNVRLLETKLKELSKVNSKVKIAIEVSIKGTNLEEFKLITRSHFYPSAERFKKEFGWNLGAYSPEELFYFNINAYYKLKEVASSTSNLRPTVIAGFGVNESYLVKGGGSKNRITIEFKDNKPIYHSKFWSEDFRRLYEDYTKEAPKIFGPQFTKMPMYGIKDLFEYGWVRRALKQGELIYDNRWYDAKFRKNEALEEAFADILEKFFFTDNRTYYLALIGGKEPSSL